MHNISLEPARLTDSGRPILSSGQEVERFLYEGVSTEPNVVTGPITVHSICSGKSKRCQCRWISSFMTVGESRVRCLRDIMEAIWS